ncbi:MAG: hypothetical protein KF701_00300 [Anaerolineales bacterium]|nr:MAG: hypothetical protein KF701_00300 [Anaerolineales bacterium]
MHKLLSEFVFDGLAPQQAREKYSRDFDSQNRAASIVHGEKLAGVEQVVWNCTMADVRMSTAEQYCEDVRRWAQQVCQDGAGLVAATNEG